MTQGAPATRAEFVERRLGFDDDRVDAGGDERTGLLLQCRLRLSGRQFAIGFEDGAERPDIAQNKAGPVAERLAGDAGAGGIDGRQVVLVGVAPEHQAAAAKRVRDQTIGARLDVPPLDREHAFGMGQVPSLAAGALLQAGEHELGAHGAVANQAPSQHDFMQRDFGRVHTEGNHGCTLMGTGSEEPGSAFVRISVNSVVGPERSGLR